MTIENLIHRGYILSEIADIEKLKDEYDMWCSEISTSLRENGISQETLSEVKVRMHYQENEFSKDNTRESILNALKRTLLFLKNWHAASGECMPANLAFEMIGKILDNFYLYYRAMYHNPVHRRGTLAQEILESVKIGNEYDLQRMLYSLLLPLFPTARLETVNDNGYSGMRADIYLEEYRLIIETKCTRESMTEKKLFEELGADAFLYQADTIFFFVYDSIGLIKNPTALKKAFSRDQEKDGKQIRLCILQSVVI